MNLHTGTGDQGDTSLIDGSRVAKDDVRVAACGSIDELSAVLGWCRAVCEGKIAQSILEIQGQLFGLGAELATPPATSGKWGFLPISKDHCRGLESRIDEAQAAVEPLSQLVLPGGTEAACRLHVARTCCRRAERSLVSLHRVSPVRAELLVYLNRLGDLLFAWARLANHQSGCPEITWRSNA